MPLFAHKQTSALDNCWWNDSMSASSVLCVSFARWAVWETTLGSRTRSAAGSPCGSAQGGRCWGTPDLGSAPVWKQDTRDTLAHSIFFGLHSRTHTPTPPASPVHVRQPAAGVGRCPPPSRSGRTGQRPSCSPSPGSHRCSWVGTPPALGRAWDTGFIDIMGVDV